MLKQIILSAVKSKLGQMIIEALLADFIQWLRSKLLFEKTVNPSLKIPDDRTDNEIAKEYCNTQLQKFQPKN